MCTIGGILKTFPWGKVEDPLLGEGGPAEPGRVWDGTRSDLVPPLFRRCGGTFPQGKAKSPLLLGEGGRAKP